MVWFVNRFPKVSISRQGPRWMIRILYLRRIKSFNIETKHHKNHSMEYRKVNIAMQGTKPTIFPSRMFLKLKTFHWDFERRNEVCNYGWQRKMSSEVVEKNYWWGFFLEISNCEDIDARNTNPQISFWNPLYN